MAIVYGVGECINDGELLLIKELESRLPDNYHVIHNWQLPSTAKQYREIDVIVIAPHAIYIIENKHWSGEVKGNDKEVISGNRNFLNPYIQVSQQAKALGSYFDDKLEKNVSWKIWVEPVVNISGSVPNILIKGDRADRFFTLENICDFLENPKQLTAPFIPEIDLQEILGCFLE